MSYLHTVGEAGAAAWEVATSSTGLEGAEGTGGSRVPWAGEEGLSRCWDDELWPPRVFTMIGMDEGFRMGEGFCFCRGEFRREEFRK